MNIPQIHLAACARELAAAKFHQEAADAALRRATKASERMGAVWTEGEATQRDLTAATNMTGGVLLTVLRAADLTPSEAGIET